MIWWFVRTRRWHKPVEPNNLRIARSSASPFQSREPQQGRKLQTLTFRDKPPLQRERIDVCVMRPCIGFD
jgi:hypothetical protein